MGIEETKKEKWYKRRSSKLFSKYFGFEEGIDITDDVAVLHRRNIVIKNIIFVSNLFYTILLFTLSISTGSKADWVITFISFPITFLINNLLKDLIFIDEKDDTKQKIAMYVASLYVFLSSILIYAKLYSVSSGDTVVYETASYVLIYYSLVIISLYQYKDLLLKLFLTMFISMTSIHVFLTYHFFEFSAGLTMGEYLKNFVRTPQMADLVLRSIIFLLFYLILYVIVSISQYMQEERKKELIKRRQVQDDFATIVGKLFNAVFINSYIQVNEHTAGNVKEISLKLANYMGYDEKRFKIISDFSMVHLRSNEIKDFNLTNSFNESSYEELKVKTHLGAEIIKRMELSQNVDMMVRQFVEKTLKEERIKSIMETHGDLNSQIIMLSDIYLTLRGRPGYKRPYDHTLSLKVIQDVFVPYFEQELMQRFFMFESEINETFDSFTKLDFKF